MKKRLLIIGCFVLYAAIIILPALIYHYVYPNNNDDTMGHFSIIVANGLANPFKDNFIYAGYIYLEYPMLAISKFLHVNFYTVWVWFNIIIMIPLGYILYYIGTKLINWQTGLLMLFLPTIVSNGLMTYQDSGVIYSMLLVGLLMPLLILIFVKYWEQKKVWQLVFLFILIIITSTFHTSGVYIPIAAGGSLCGFLIYKLIKRQKDFKRATVLGISIIGVSLISIAVLTPQTFQFVHHLVGVVSPNVITVIPTQQTTQINSSRVYSMPVWYWAVSFVSLGIIASIIISIYAIIKDKIKLSSQVKMYLYILFCWICAMLVLGFGKVSVDPIRAEMDTSIIVAIFAAILLGSVIIGMKDKTILIMLAIIVVACSAETLHLHFQNNSAVKTADKEAIAYLNTLDYTNYNCSSTLSYWIYDQLINEKYSADATDLIITRNISMTPRSNATDPTYISHGYTLNSQDVLIKSFSSGGVTVDIYERE